MKKFDVVIIGAGPGGLRCAEILGNSKKKVLLVDKKKVIGPKVCAGGITGSNIQHFELPPKIIDHSYNKIKIYVGNKHKYLKQKESFVYTADRLNLGQYQLTKLNKKYVTVLKNTTISLIGKDYVQTTKGDKFGFEKLIGADGSNSIVRKYLNIDTKKVAVGIQYKIPTKNTDKIEFEMIANAKMFHSGYTWIFPHKDYVFYGAMCNPKKFSVNKLKENFHSWLDSRGINYSGYEYSAHTINFDYQGVKFDNVFLIGDAAGLASGITGEGIQQALISGEEVAKLIINPQHEMKLLKSVLRVKRIQEYCLKSLELGLPLRWIELKLFLTMLGNRKFNKKVIELFV